MTRTATHIHTSPNPALLEMRILANHGADPRFDFLRGRWKKRWANVKSEVARGKEPTLTTPAGGLVGYGSEDSEDEPEASAVKAAAVPCRNELEREAKRARLKAWTENRRKEKAKVDGRE